MSETKKKTSNCSSRKEKRCGALSLRKKKRGGGRVDPAPAPVRGTSTIIDREEKSGRARSWRKKKAFKRLGMKEKEIGIICVGEGCGRQAKPVFRNKRGGEGLIQGKGGDAYHC